MGTEQAVSLWKRHSGAEVFRVFGWEQSKLCPCGRDTVVLRYSECLDGNSASCVYVERLTVISVVTLMTNLFLLKTVFV